MMKKFLRAVFVLALVLVFLAGCAPAANANEIKIGANFELSGAGATYGEGTMAGIQMAIDEINAAGGINGKKVTIVKYDNKTDAAESTTLASKLMTQDKVIAVLGPATTGATKAEIPVANKNKVPIISGSATADNVTYDGSTVQEYAFRICYNDSFQGTVVANFAMKNLSFTKGVILMDSSNDYGKGLSDSFTKAFTAGGGTIAATEAYVTGDTDFKAILTKIKDLDYQFIFISGYYNEAGLIIKQARELGIAVPVLGADGFDSPKLLELAGAAALNDVYYSNHYSSLDQDATVQQFIKDFKAKNNAEPNGFNALGYDLAKFVCDAIGRSEKLDSASLKAAIESTKDFKAVTGSITMDPATHNPIKSIVIIGLKDGQPSTSVKVNPS
jgi:branched-chain amino acid transport system substrate-binding protein